MMVCMYMMLKKSPPDMDNLLEVENPDGNDASVNYVVNFTTSEIGEAMYGGKPDREAANKTVYGGDEFSTDK